MTKSERTPVVVGYAHLVEGEPVPSIEEQKKAIEENIAGIDVEYVGTTVDHRLAGHGLPYWRRPGLATLLDRLDPDDHVVVWRLCRLDPNFRGVVKALKQLINQQVVVHAIEEFGDFDRLELRDAPGRAFVKVLSWAVEFQKWESRVRSRAAIEHHKTCSLPVGHCPMGHKRVTRTDPANPRRKTKWDVWDQRECQQLREIYQRHVVEGERIIKIAEDFFARNEKTAMGRLWVRRGRRTGKLEPRRLYKAIELMKEVLKLDDPGHPLLAGWLPPDVPSLQSDVAEQPTE